MIKRGMTALSALLMTLSCWAEKPKKIVLVTHESIPYMADSMPAQGALSYALKKVFKNMDYSLEIYMVNSWTRAKVKAQKDGEFDGYFPYITIENQDIFAFSDYFYEDSWVIIERKEKPIRWSKFEDLTKYMAGNVLGVEFRPGVKELVDAKKLNVTSTSSDINNIRLLANKRVDFIFIDPVTFRYHMATEPLLRPYRGQLQINAKPINISRYGLAVKKDRLRSGFMTDFNRVGKSVKKYVDEYIANLEKKAAKK